MGIELVEDVFKHYSDEVSIGYAIGQALNGSRLKAIEDWSPDTSTQIAKMLVGASPKEARHWATDHKNIRWYSIKKGDDGYRRSLSVRIAIVRELRESTENI